MCKILGANKVYYGRCANGKLANFLACPQKIPPPSPATALSSFLLGYFYSDQLVEIFVCNGTLLGCD